MRRLLSGLIAAITLIGGSTAFAADTVPIKFTLDWKYQSIHAFVFWAKEKGYFAKEGLDVTIDQGSGSAATVTRIVSGAYDAGFGDMNAIIQLAGKDPGKQPVMVYMIYSSPPFALITKASGPIKTVKDMAGHTLGYPAGSSAGKLFVPLAKSNDLDMSKVKIVNMTPNLQEQMMLRGEVDASAVFTVTSYVNLIGQKINPDKDIRWLYYSDFGVSPYANGIMVSQKLIKEHPDAVTGLVKALNKAFIEVAADPESGTALMLKQEPLLKPDLEKQRLLFAYKTHFITPETDKIGVGDVTDARMKQTIQLNVDAYDLKHAPMVEDVFSRKFLPPQADRQIKLKM